MRLIIDPGALSKPPHARRVKDFLMASPQNEVLFTDFALREAFQDANRDRLIRTFQPVHGHAAQVWALKLTPEVAKLEPRGEDPGRQFIDELQSNRLRTYLHDVFTDAHHVGDAIATASTESRRRLGELLATAPMVKTDIERFLGNIPEDDLAKLRRKKVITHAVKDAMIEGVTYDMALLLKEEGIDRVPDPLENSFMFRFIVANYVLALFWGLRGGLEAVKAKTLRNDVTDTTYAAFATYYEGLVTNDLKLEGVYQNTKRVLRTFFDIP